MKSANCPYCGSSQIIRSPSGRHLTCVSCNRVLVQPRIKKPRGRSARNKSDDLEFQRLNKAKK